MQYLSLAEGRAAWLTTPVAAASATGWDSDVGWGVDGICCLPFTATGFDQLMVTVIVDLPSIKVQFQLTTS